MHTALRSLARSPGFCAIAILTLALGIGFSASSFSMANAFLLRDVPYPDPERLVRIFATNRESQNRGHAPANLLALRESAASFAGFAIFNHDNFSLGEPGQPAEQVDGLSVTADFLDVLGVQPALGRGFAPGDDQPDQPRVVILTHRAWLRRFAADPGVIGRTVRLNTLPCTIVGVLPPGFNAPLVWGPVEFIAPRTLEASFRTDFKSSWMQAVARLKPGLPLAAAQSELDTLAARLVQAHPKENVGLGLRATALHDSNMDSVSRSLLWLMTALSLLMLVIACANLASLQVARAFARSREFAVRSALGGSTRQLMGPLFAESLVLALAGGLGGLFVSLWSSDLVGSFLLINNERGFEIPFDFRVFAFALAASLLSGFAFGLAPAWIAARSPAAEALKEGTRSATASRSQHRLKSGLIVAEVALAFALVAVSATFGVAAKTFLHRPLGWQMDGLFQGFVAMPFNAYSEPARQRAFHRAVLDRIAALPGIEHATLATNLPVYSLGGTQRLAIEGQPPAPRGREPSAQVASVTSGYFATLGMAFRQGAPFADGVTEKDPLVAVVNEAFAQRFWPGENPVGRHFRLGDDDRPVEIVGVVADVELAVRFDAPATRLHVFRPLAQFPSRYLAIVARSTLPAETLAKGIREAVSAFDPDLPVARPGSLRSDVDRNLSNIDLAIVNLGISAGMGLLIAAVGLFGVISQLTFQRTRDIGVRIALGAQRRDILSMVLGEGAKLLVAGLAIGIPAFYVLQTFLTRAMPGLRLPGPWLLLVNLLVLVGAMFLAAWLPARRATRIDPVEALRAD